MDCIGCLEPKEDEIVFETDHWKVILADDQAYLGRCYVTLKRHCETVLDLTSPEWSDLQSVMKKLEATLKAAFNATMFNWTCLMNLAYQNTPPNPHVHWHFKPRYQSPVTIDQELFTDDEIGHHYSVQRHHVVDGSLYQVIRAKIQNSL